MKLRFTVWSAVAVLLAMAPAAYGQLPIQVRLQQLLGPPIIWSGGCSNTVSNAPANVAMRYCTDREDFNTAATHLSVAPSGDITVKVAGYYRINFRTIAYGCDSLIIDVDRNGSTVHQSQNKLNPPSDPDYVDNSADMVWPYNVGDTLAVTLAHSGSSSCASVLYWSWSPLGSLSRLQVQYLGPLH
jgi:hypothetical protein